jgi:hypothetical protein
LSGAGKLTFAIIDAEDKWAVDKILHVESPSPNHLYWPELDVDLAVKSIRHPEKFPLVSQVGAYE